MLFKYELLCPVLPLAGPFLLYRRVIKYCFKAANGPVYRQGPFGSNLTLPFSISKACTSSFNPNSSTGLLGQPNYCL